MAEWPKTRQQYRHDDTFEIDQPDVIPADLGRELYEELIALRQELDAARNEAAHEAAFSTHYTRPMKELTERVADEMYPEGGPGHLHGGGSPATLRYEREVGA